MLSLQNPPIYASRIHFGGDVPLIAMSAQRFYDVFRKKLETEDFRKLYLTCAPIDDCTVPVRAHFLLDAEDDFGNTIRLNIEDRAIAHLESFDVTQDFAFSRIRTNVILHDDNGIVQRPELIRIAQAHDPRLRVVVDDVLSEAYRRSRIERAPDAA